MLESLATIQWRGCQSAMCAGSSVATVVSQLYHAFKMTTFVDFFANFWSRQQLQSVLIFHAAEARVPALNHLREAQTRTLGGPSLIRGLYSTPRERRKNEMCGGRWKKKKKFWTPPHQPPLPTLGPFTNPGHHPSCSHLLGPPPFGPPLFLGLGSHPTLWSPSSLVSIVCSFFHFPFIVLFSFFFS